MPRLRRMAIETMPFFGEAGESVTSERGPF